MVSDRPLAAAGLGIEKSLDLLRRHLGRAESIEQSAHPLVAVGLPNRPQGAAVGATQPQAGPLAAETTSHSQRLQWKPPKIHNGDTRAGDGPGLSILSSACERSSRRSISSFRPFALAATNGARAPASARPVASMYSARMLPIVRAAAELSDRATITSVRLACPARRPSDACGHAPATPAGAPMRRSPERFVGSSTTATQATQAPSAPC